MSYLLDSFSSEADRLLVQQFQALQQRRGVETRMAMDAVVMSASRQVVEIVLNRDVSPPELFKSLLLSDEVKEFSCFTLEIGHAESTEEEEIFRTVAKLSAWPILLQRDQDRSLVRAQIRPVLSMDMEAVDMLAILLAILGLPHHWTLTPVAGSKYSRPMDSFSQRQLYESKMTLSQLAREMQEKGHTKLAVGVFVGYSLGPATLAPYPSMLFSMSGTGKSDDHPPYKPRTQPKCYATQEPYVEGAHLVDRKYDFWFEQVIDALTVQFVDSDSQMDDYFSRVKRALEGFQSVVDLEKMPGDIVSLDRTVHHLFDRCYLFLNPLGSTPWLWVSERSMPGSLLWTLAGRGSADSEALLSETARPQTLQELLQQDKRLAAPMFASACKVALIAFGSEALKAVYERLADKHVKKMSARESPSSKLSGDGTGGGPQTPRSAATSPRSSRGQPSPRTPRTSSPPPGPTDVDGSSFGRQRVVGLERPVQAVGSSDSEGDVHVSSDQLLGSTTVGSSSGGLLYVGVAPTFCR
ncbi:MAG: hypothetical protein EOO38_02545 [Cytophagaceae bacterium]|nr:MAG: hypothetical protein EOO38_02545 [Cytophagaceae bacterium]